MRIELLYFDGCPNHEAFLPHLRELLSRERRTEEVRLRRVESPEHAERERFLGSPTLRIDGRDVEPGAGGVAVSSSAATTAPASRTRAKPSRRSSFSSRGMRVAGPTSTGNVTR